MPTSSRGNPVQFEEWERIGQQNVMLFTNREQLCISGKLDPATKGQCSVPRSLRLPITQCFLLDTTYCSCGFNTCPRWISIGSSVSFGTRDSHDTLETEQSSTSACLRIICACRPKVAETANTLHQNIALSPYRGLFSRGPSKNQIRTDCFRRASACCRTGHGMLSCPGKLSLLHATKTSDGSLILI